MGNVQNNTRVLVLDDERNIADTLAVILRSAGYEVLAVYSGEQAIDAARRFPPDILLADYSMPGTNGLEAAKAIKNTYPGCRIVMLSGQLLGKDFEPYKAKGYNFLLLQKPMHPDKLLDALNSENEIADDRISLEARILNVDDVESHRYSITRLLTRAGFAVSEAATGAEAVRKALESHFDLVLLDIHLPDQSGYDVCESLRERPETAKIAVVHITASDKSEEAARKSASVGADEYLTYPIVPRRLLHRIRELLQLQYLQANDSNL